MLIITRSKTGKSPPRKSYSCVARASVLMIKYFARGNRTPRRARLCKRERGCTRVRVGCTYTYVGYMYVRSVSDHDCLCRIVIRATFIWQSLIVAISRRIQNSLSKRTSACNRAIDIEMATRRADIARALRALALGSAFGNVRYWRLMPANAS